jgi:hypothetical protein
MTKMIFDSVMAAVAHLDAEHVGTGFVDGIRAIDLSDAQQSLAFLAPQLLRVEQGTYMLRYPLADYAEFMPVDTTGTIWSAGSLYYSGDIAGKPEWFDVAADDMPYADVSRTQFLQENHMAGIGYKWNRMDMERGQQLGVNVLAEKADAATKTAERFIHRTAMRGDGTKFDTGFINNPLATKATAAQAIATGTPDQAIAVVNDALTSIEVNTGETYQANTLAVPTSIFNVMASRRVTDTGTSLLRYLQDNSVIPGLTIKKSRHLETAGDGSTRRMIAYANVLEVHRFHLPGGGHQLFSAQPYQKGPFSWEVPGLMNIGGYENRIPKAITMVDGV